MLQAFSRREDQRHALVGVQLRFTWRMAGGGWQVCMGQFLWSLKLLVQGIFVAAYVILRFCKPPIEIVTDYEGLLTGWERGPEICESGDDASSEAWRLFWSAIHDFGKGLVTIRRVPAHLPRSAILDGRISESDWVGNRIAGAQARLGAARHPDLDILREKVDQADSLKLHQEALGQYLGKLNMHIMRESFHDHWLMQDAIGGEWKQQAIGEQQRTQDAGVVESDWLKVGRLPQGHLQVLRQGFGGHFCSEGSDASAHRQPRGVAPEASVATAAASAGVQGRWCSGASVTLGLQHPTAATSSPPHPHADRGSGNSW